MADVEVYGTDWCEDTQGTRQHLEGLGMEYQYINIEQDLGIAGLRMSKRSYFPCGYLRKFSVSYRESQAA